MQIHDISKKFSNLTPNQEKVLAYLITEPTIASASDKAEVSDRTIYKWLAEDKAFKEAYRMARHEIIKHAIITLQQDVVQAVKVLKDIMLDIEVPPGTRASSAKFLIDTSLKTLTLDKILEPKINYIDNTITLVDDTIEDYIERYLKS